MAENKNKKVTLKDVSKAAGLSLITVSRALRKPETVHEKTREKIQKTIEEIGYIPNLTARSLVSQRSDMTGVVVPILASSLFADFAQGISQILEPRRQQMLLAVSDWSPQKEEEAVRTFIARQADAIIVTGFSHTEATRKLLTNFSGPVVEAWNLRESVFDSAVGFDNYAAAVDMTRYLIDKGYQDIVMVGGAASQNDQAEDRTRGVIDTLRAAGRSVDVETIVEFDHPATIDAGVQLVQKLMTRKRRPDAILFLAELPAQGAVLWCHANGVSVPNDVAIAGFGDLNMSSLLPVPLTTVQIKGRAIGKKSAQLVIDRLDGSVSKPEIHDIGYRLQIRQST